MPGIQVDGNDILSVYAAAVEAVERARSGKGPTLIECVTYRMNMHTTADDPKKYRKEEEVESWRKKDPIPRFQNYLKEKGLLSDTEIGKVEEEIKAQIQQAVEHAEEQMKEMGDPQVMFDHVYAEETPDILAQREKLARELEDVSEEEKHG
jgi:pyruvate dehydrogenase E1 component alpha subunit